MRKVAFGLIALGLFSQIAQAIPIVDVNNLGPTDTFLPGIPVAAHGVLGIGQAAAVVTVGSAGLLSQLDVQVASSAANPWRMHLLPVVGSAPSTDFSSAFATVEFTTPAWPGGTANYSATSFSLASFGMNFSVGDQFAIAFESLNPSIWGGWAIPAGNHASVAGFNRYSANGASWLLNADVALRTWMDADPAPSTSVPEPGTMGLFMAGLLAAFARRRRTA